MSQIKLKAVTNINSQGAAFEFEGRKAFNSMWFSWEHIASKMVGESVEAKQFEPTENPQQEDYRAIADNCRADASRNGDVLIKIQDLVSNWAQGK